MRLVPHNETHFGVKAPGESTHHTVLKDKFGATFKKAPIYAWLIKMEYLEAIIAEWPDVQYTSSQFPDIDWAEVERIHFKRQSERAGNLMCSLRSAGYVIIDTGSKLRIWGPEDDGHNVFWNMPDIETRLNNLYEFVISEAEYRSHEEAPQPATTFVPRGAAITLSEAHWKGLKQ